MDYSFNFIMNNTTIDHDFILWLDKHYQSFIPYLRIRSCDIKIDESQFVRNIATLQTLLNYKSVLSSRLLHLIDKNLMQYYERFITQPQSMQQASSFLLRALRYKQGYEDKIQNIGHYLYETAEKDLKPNLVQFENNFEKGEVIIALCYVAKSTQQQEVLYQQYLAMRHLIESLSPLDFDHVFTLNWHAQMIYHLCATASVELIEAQKYAHIIYEKLKIILSSIEPYAQIETNYWAVLFEGLASLYYLLPDHTAEIQDYIERTFSKLMYQYDDGLFNFLNGDARLDITGHILNGITALKNSPHN
ncbi:hypothetical protein OAT84_02685 [Gammaproteobacteria bacterium]|nr:hypothetical protein [Gammaproteobacteria bacterium]